jgi:hypothetical protein
MTAITMDVRQFFGSAAAHPSHHPRITRLPCKKRASGHLGGPVGGRGFVQNFLGLAGGFMGTGLWFRGCGLGSGVEGLGIGIKV